MKKQNDEPDIEEDSDEYVMLKVPYIFHIKYNSINENFLHFFFFLLFEDP